MNDGTFASSLVYCVVYVVARFSDDLERRERAIRTEKKKYCLARTRDMMKQRDG